MYFDNHFALAAGEAGGLYSCVSFPPDNYVICASLSYSEQSPVVLGKYIHVTVVYTNYTEFQEKLPRVGT